MSNLEQCEFCNDEVEERFTLEVYGEDMELCENCYNNMKDVLRAESTASIP